MKFGIIGLFLLCSQAFAYEFGGSLDEYDADTGQYFSFVAEREEAARSYSSRPARDRVNIFIYSPSKKTGRTVFDKPPGKIGAVVIESEYDMANRKMGYLGATSQIKNNKNIDPRKPSPTMLVETLGSDDIYTVWKADKTGGEPKAIFTYKEPDKWHVDTRARVIRLLKRNGATFSVSEYAW